jgi:hypothetical protein
MLIRANGDRSPMLKRSLRTMSRENTAARPSSTEAQEPTATSEPHRDDGSSRTLELPRVLSQEDQATLVAGFPVRETPPQEPRPESRHIFLPLPTIKDELITERVDSLSV